MLGDTLRVLRTQRGMTQEQLGAIVGLSPNSIQFYEENKWQPGAEVVAKLAAALSVPVEDFVGYDCTIITDEKGTTRYVKNKDGRFTVMASFSCHPARQLPS